MKFISTIIILLIPSLTFANSLSYSKGFALIFTIPISAVCLFIALIISGRAKSPMSFIGLFLIAAFSFAPAISTINDGGITFKNSNIFYPLQLALLALLIVPFWKLCKFTLKWKIDYTNSEQQSAYAWRKTKNSLEKKLKNCPLEYSISKNGVTNTAYLDFKNEMYLLKIHSNELGNKTLITDKKFDSVELLNNYLTNSTIFRVHDFLV